MKKFLVLFFFAAILITACQSKSDKASTNAAADTTKTAAQGKYFCPMCAGQESDKPGKCSHCGMDLEKKQ